MKKLVTLLLLICSLTSIAQTAPAPKTVIDENTIVRDVSGGLVPYVIWKKLMQTGDYSLRSNQTRTEFVIYQLNETEKEQAAERKKKMAPTLPKPRESESFIVGEKFKADRITDINGNKYDLKTIGDKIYVINFWFINCPPCKQEIPELNEMVERYKENKNVVFLAIALDEKYDLKEFLKKVPFNYNIVADGRYYAEKQNVKAYPTHVIIGKDGLIKFSTLGLAANTVYWIEKVIKEQIGI